MKTDWQLMCEALTATREASDARWHILNVPRGTKMQEDTMEADLLVAAQDSPTQDFDEIMEETRFAIFHTYSADPGPIGKDQAYVCPAHRWLGLVQEAAAKLMEAADCALAEMPASLRREAKAARFVSDGWQSVAEGGAPEARRLMQVRAVVVLLNGLVEELANEGRPRPLPAPLVRTRRAV